MIGTEEAIEAALFGRARYCEQLVVGRTLLGFGEDPQFHVWTIRRLR